MKNFVLGIAFTVAVLVIGGLGYLLLGFAEVRGDLPPSRLESAVLRRAVHALPRRYREVVVLCDLEEVDYADAAAALGCPIGTVRSRLHRARACALSSPRE